MQGRYNVLFLCTGNSARSIMAEAILKHRGGAHFAAYSAGSNPSGTVRPGALAQLESAHMPTRGLRSKSWEEFASSKAPKLDFVFTVCDHAAKEVCPIWPGQPMTALGHSRSRRRARDGRADTKSLQGCIFHPRSQDQFVHPSASHQPWPPCHEERNRPNWGSISHTRLFPLSSRN
jgi:protein-tyrosine-phosphatase